MRLLPRLGRLSIRSRLMAIGVTGVTAALLVGGLLLYATMSTALTRSVDDEARAGARSVAALVGTGRLPDPVPVSGSQVVQVLDAAGRVVGGSATADRLTPLVTEAERARLLDGATVTVPGYRAARSGELRVAGLGVGTGSGRLTVVAAVPTADLETSRRVLRVLLLVFFPLFVAALALVSWRVIGAALRPVEELRRGAELIGAGSSAAERLAVPPTRDELSALARTLNGMLDRLAAARARQRSFVADAAHELRSPLATMRTQLEVADRLGDGGGLPGDLLPEVDRLAGLVEDLLVLARVEDGRLTTRVEDVDVADLLADVARRRGGARVPVTVRPVASRSLGAGVTVRGDRAQLVRAVGNLVDNAVRHAATAVTLSVRALPALVEVVVTDDGHGVPEEERERVFERFARLDEARDRDSGGSGLGLAIARELLRVGGGAIRLEDAGPGLRAVVTLPRAGRGPGGPHRR